VCDTPRLALSVAEFGRSIGVGRRKAYQLAREIGIYADGRLLVPVTAIEAWMSARSDERASAMEVSP
jgi:hypothetical protein